MSRPNKWRLMRRGSLSVARFVSKGIEYQPSDIFFNGKTAADMVYTWAMKKHTPSYQRSLARYFLKTWPDGPQLPLRIQHIWRPIKNKIVRSVSLSREDYERIPGKKSEYMRKAILEKLKRDGLI